MANVEDQNIPPEYAELYEKNVTTRPGFWGVKVDKKYEIFRTRNFGDLVAQSYFPTIAAWWNALTDVQRARWTSAGQYSGQSGWDLFAQDTAYRISNAIAGLGEPHLMHQFKVGHIKIEAPATGIEIRLEIPYSGNSDVSCYFNAISNLVSLGNPHEATCYLDFEMEDEYGWEWFQEEFPFYNYAAWDWFGDYYDWSGMKIRNMRLTIKIVNMRGDLYFDDVLFLVNDTNFAYDPNCDTIETSWHIVNVPAGASFQSVYSRNAFYYP